MLRLWRWLVMRADTIVAIVPMFVIAEALRLLHYRTFWAGFYLGCAFFVWNNFVGRQRRRYCKEAA